MQVTLTRLRETRRLTVSVDMFTYTPVLRAIRKQQRSPLAPLAGLLMTGHRVSNDEQAAREPSSFSCPPLYLYLFASEATISLLAETIQRDRNARRRSASGGSLRRSLVRLQGLPVLLVFVLRPFLHSFAQSAQAAWSRLLLLVLASQLLTCQLRFPSALFGKSVV